MRTMWIPSDTMKSMKRPNVVFVMLDTISADRLRLYGGTAKMPNLERIGKHGTRYLNAIAPGTYTLPSHISVFLGKRVRNIRALLKNPIKNQKKSTDPLFLKNKYITGNDHTLPMQMSHLGYKTSLFSNNPFVTQSTGLSTGFSYVRNVFIENKQKYHKTTLKIISNDFSRENLTKIAYYVSSVLPSRSVDELYFHLRRKLNRKVCNETGAYTLDQGAMLTNDIIDKYLAATGPDNHFLFANYMEAHEGYPTNLITKRDISQDRWMYVSGMIDPEGIEVLKKAYEKRLEYLDSKIKNMVEILKRNGVLDNAILVLASDHGQAFGEHGQVYHNLFPYNEISKVPLITAKYENGKQIKERREIDKPVSIKSLHTSIMGVGYGKMSNIDDMLANEDYVFSDHTGMLDVWDIPLLKMLKSRSKNARLLYETKLKYNVFASAVYNDKYKLIHYYNGSRRDEMYNLAEDPGETKNIIRDNRSMALKILDANRIHVSSSR